MSVKYSIVLPAYNEQKNVSILYREFTDVLTQISDAYEIVFVDDGSSDNTFGELQKLHRQDNRVKIIRLRRNFGQTAALYAGFQYAKGDIIISMDADLQDNPHELPRLLKKMNEGYDVVCAWRKKRSDSLGKRALSMFAWILRQTIIGDGIHDSGCQFRVYTREAVKDLQLYGELHRFIPALLQLKGYNVTEIAVKHRKRKYGKTKYTITRVLKGLADIITVKFWQQFANRPVHFFGGLGLIFSVLGFLAGLELVIAKFFRGMAIANRPLLILCALLIIVGVQLFMMGVLADMIVKTHYASHDKLPYSIQSIVE